jgi:hypothetical protein
MYEKIWRWWRVSSETSRLRVAASALFEAPGAAGSSSIGRLDSGTTGMSPVVGNRSGSPHTAMAAFLLTVNPLFVPARIH